MDPVGSHIRSDVTEVRFETSRSLYQERLNRRSRNESAGCSNSGDQQTRREENTVDAFSVEAVVALSDTSSSIISSKLNSLDQLITVHSNPNFSL